MASTFRRRYTASDGRTRCAKTYTVVVKIGDRFERLSGFRDRKASEELGRRIERLANLKAAGEQPDADLTRWIEGLPTKLRDRLARLGLLTGRAAAATRKLSEHLAEYRQALLDGVASRRQKGPATAKHAKLVHHRVETLLQGISATFISDVVPEAVGRWLADCRAKGMSVQTSNHYVTNAKSFLNWMIRSKRASENPLASIGRQQVTPNVRTYVRRPLEHDEAAALLRATRTGPTHNGMTGEERYWLYRIALETALRAGELRTLTPESFLLDGPEPSVYLPGNDTKNRQDAELPLRPDTATELRTFLADKPKAERVFQMPRAWDVVEMFHKDLAVARTTWLDGLPSVHGRADEEVESFCSRCDNAGRKVDFHALRGTCLSWLADAGASVKALQEFARHSDPKLTMNCYAQTLRGTQSRLAALLPDLGDEDRPNREATRMTGTNSIPSDAGARTKPAASKRMRQRMRQSTAHLGSHSCNSGHDDSGLGESGVVTEGLAKQGTCVTPRGTRVNRAPVAQWIEQRFPKP
ncbi:MAG: tyrosine-type recombinase/integrase [Dehalococcoidia bacterium]